MLTIQELAAERMIKGKASHPDQTWPMERSVMDAELREELADSWNYVSGHRYENFIKEHLVKIWGKI